jgi:hypothetical protein
MEKAAKGRPRGGGSKLNRTETVTMRLDPRLRYLTELAARKQRRTVSSFIEWAIEQALSHVTLDEDKDVKVIAASTRLWDPDEADRFAKLALSYPQLLTYEEQVLWKLIQECKGLWRRVPPSVTSPVETIMRHLASMEAPRVLDYPQLRAHWEALKQVAAGEADKNILPLLEDPQKRVVCQVEQ